MSELLAPAGNMEALHAAVANGADAVYLGMTKFGARAYSDNFDEETLPQAVAYCHLRGVKVYATVNTIVYQDELPDVFAELEFLNGAGVDGVIVQDLAVLRYVVEHFPAMEAHTSTQMGIDDVEGARMAKELGARRVVVAREADIATVRRIRNEADVPVEVFVHGALCVSYSGNCIMSGMTGNRLGNRGRCIGSCRKLYTVTDTTTGETLGQNYILSTKDLNTIDHASDLTGIDSLKIEGRMKEPIYVANVVSKYRAALDGRADAEDTARLNRTFHRTFTSGYLFNEDRKNITNIQRPNHHGFEAGVVSGFRRGMTEIRLTAPLRQGDVVRIRHEDEDVNLTVAKLYDAAGNLINGAEADTRCYLKIRERLAVDDLLYITKDAAYTRQLEDMLEGEYRTFPLDFSVFAWPEAPLTVEGRAWGLSYTYVGEEALSEALNRPTGQADVEKQLDRLGGTLFRLGTVNFQGENVFIPAKMLNAARKAIVDALCEMRVAAAAERRDAAAAAPAAPAPLAPVGAPAATPAAASAEGGAAPILTASCTTAAQYEACVSAGLAAVYYENIIPRNAATYVPHEGPVLVGGLGGVFAYRGTNKWVADYSLNTVNATAAAELRRLGAERVTLSYELNRTQIADLVAAYRQQFGAEPSLEMIVYGRAPLLVTKYCPLKPMGQCGKCKTHRYEIAEERGTFPILTHENCNTTVLNGKILNLLDEMPGLDGIAAFRLNFTTETPEEVAHVIATAKAKLAGTMPESAFNQATDTRGHWNREIL